jgi:site-specific DNA-adenine methylase
VKKTLYQIYEIVKESKKHAQTNIFHLKQIREDKESFYKQILSLYETQNKKKGASNF